MTGYLKNKLNIIILFVFFSIILYNAIIKIQENFILNFWEPYIDKSIVTIIDSKTKLQEFSLKRFKVLPKYTFFKKTGPQHNPLFKTIVEIPESKKISGSGSSKKQAQQNAAAKLIKVLKI